jgi:hypothetical protein
MPSTETLPPGGKEDFVTSFLVLFPARYIINIGELAGFASVRSLATGILLLISGSP